MLLPSLSYKDILKVTNEFPLENLTGSGTFGVVYKAILDQGRTLGHLCNNQTLTHIYLFKSY